MLPFRDLGGYTESVARQRLEDAGLSVGTVSEAYSSTVGKGYVIDQTASPGSSVEAGTSVGFTSEPRTGTSAGGSVIRGDTDTGTGTDTDTGETTE